MKMQIRVLGLAVLAMLGGCRVFSHSCSAPSYGSGETLPPLRVPPGLQAPDTRNALQIPQLNEPERPSDNSGRCLDEPPAYAPNLNLDKKLPKAEEGRKTDAKSGKSSDQADEKAQQ